MSAVNDVAPVATGVHPFAERFALLPDEDAERLAADIAENGLRNPIVLNADGLILDGRNRMIACERAGVTPNFTTYEGDEAAFVLSQNVNRRHLTTGQQAMSTALVLVEAGRRQNGRWKYGAVEATFTESGKSTWRNALNQAGAVLDHAPHLAPRVVDGDMALDAAFREAESIRDQERQALAEIERMQAEEAEARARLVDLAPDYMKALDNGEYKSARQAFVAWEEDNRAEAARRRQEEAARAAAEKRRRADLSLTFTSMANGLLSIGSYGHADIEKVMADFEPSLLNPPQLIRYFDVANLRAGIAFLNDLINWKEAHDA